MIVILKFCLSKQPLQHLVSVTSENLHQLPITKHQPWWFRQQDLPLQALVWFLPRISLVLAFLLRSQAEVERRENSAECCQAQLARLLHFCAEHRTTWCATAGTLPLKPNTKLWHCPSSHGEEAALHCCFTLASHCSFQQGPAKSGSDLPPNLALSQLKGSPPLTFVHQTKAQYPNGSRKLEV